MQAQEDIDTDVEEPDDAVEEADEPSADDATVGEESEEEPAEASEDLDNAEEEDSDEELNIEESSEETDEEVEAAQNDDGLVDVPENENLEDIEELEIEEEAAKSEEIVEGEEALAEEVSLEEEDTSDALEAVLPNEGTNMPNFAVTIKKGGNSWSGNEVAGDTVPFTVNVKPGSTTKATMDTLTSAKVYLNLSWIPSDEKDTEVSFVYGTDKKVFESGEDIELDTIAWDDSNGNNLNVSAKFGDIAGEGEIQAYVKVGATVASIKGTTTVAKSGSIEIVCPAGTPSVTTDSSGSGAASVVSGGTHKFTAQVTPETFIDTSIAVGKVWTRWTWVDPNEDGYPFGTYSGPIYQAAAYDDDNRYYEATYEPTASGDIGTYSGYFKVEAVLSSSTGTYSETYNIGNWSTSVKACSSVEIVSGFTPGSITTTQAVDYGGTASINVKVTPASALGTGVKGIKAIFTVYNDQMEDRVANKNRVALVDGTGTSATEVGTIKKTCTYNAAGITTEQTLSATVKGMKPGKTAYVGVQVVAYSDNYVTQLGKAVELDDFVVTVGAATVTVNSIGLKSSVKDASTTSTTSTTDTDLDEDSTNYFYWAKLSNNTITPSAALNTTNGVHHVRIAWEATGGITLTPSDGTNNYVDVTTPVSTTYTSSVTLKANGTAGTEGSITITAQAYDSAGNTVGDAKSATYPVKILSGPIVAGGSVSFLKGGTATTSVANNEKVVVKAEFNAASDDVLTAKDVAVTFAAAKTDANASGTAASVVATAESIKKSEGKYIATTTLTGGTVATTVTATIAPDTANDYTWVGTEASGDITVDTTNAKEIKSIVFASEDISSATAVTGDKATQITVTMDGAKTLNSLQLEWLGADASSVTGQFGNTSGYGTGIDFSNGAYLATSMPKAVVSGSDNTYTFYLKLTPKAVDSGTLRVTAVSANGSSLVQSSGKLTIGGGLTSTDAAVTYSVNGTTFNTSAPTTLYKGDKRYVKVMVPTSATLTQAAAGSGVKYTAKTVFSTTDSSIGVYAVDANAAALKTSSTTKEVDATAYTTTGMGTESATDSNTDIKCFAATVMLYAYETTDLENIKISAVTTAYESGTAMGASITQTTDVMGPVLASPLASVSIKKTAGANTKFLTSTANSNQLTATVVPVRYEEGTSAPAVDHVTLTWTASGNSGGTNTLFWAGSYTSGSGPAASETFTTKITSGNYSQIKNSKDETIKLYSNDAFDGTISVSAQAYSGNNADDADNTKLGAPVEFTGFEPNIKTAQTLALDTTSSANLTSIKNMKNLMVGGTIDFGFSEADVVLSSVKTGTTTGTGAAKSNLTISVDSSYATVSGSRLTAVAPTPESASGKKEPVTVTVTCSVDGYHDATLELPYLKIWDNVTAGSISATDTSVVYFNPTGEETLDAKTVGITGTASIKPSNVSWALYEYDATKADKIKVSGTTKVPYGTNVDTTNERLGLAKSTGLTNRIICENYIGEADVTAVLQAKISQTFGTAVTKEWIVKVEQVPTAMSVARISSDGKIDMQMGDSSRMSETINRTDITFTPASNYVMADGTITVSSSDTNVATVTANSSGTTWTVNAVGVGTTDLVVTATKTGLESVSGGSVSLSETVPVTVKGTAAEIRPTYSRIDLLAGASATSIESLVGLKGYPTGSSTAITDSITYTYKITDSTGASKTDTNITLNKKTGAISAAKTDLANVSANTGTYITVTATSNAYSFTTLKLPVAVFTPISEMGYSLDKESYAVVSDSSKTFDLTLSAKNAPATDENISVAFASDKTSLLTVSNATTNNPTITPVNNQVASGTQTATITATIKRGNTVHLGTAETDEVKTCAVTIYPYGTTTVSGMNFTNANGLKTLTKATLLNGKTYSGAINTVLMPNSGTTTTYTAAIYASKEGEALTSDTAVTSVSVSNAGAITLVAGTVTAPTTRYIRVDVAESLRATDYASGWIEVVVVPEITGTLTVTRTGRTGTQTVSASNAAYTGDKLVATFTPSNADIYEYYEDPTWTPASGATGTVVPTANGTETKLVYDVTANSAGTGVVSIALQPSALSTATLNPIQATFTIKTATFSQIIAMDGTTQVKNVSLEAGDSVKLTVGGYDATGEKIFAMTNTGLQTAGTTSYDGTAVSASLSDANEDNTYTLTINGKTNGTETIRIIENSGKYEDISVTVQGATNGVTGVTLAPVGVTAKNDVYYMGSTAGTQMTLKATIAPSTATNPQTAWYMAGDDIVTLEKTSTDEVSATNTITATGVKGTCTILVMTADGGCTGSIKVSTLDTDLDVSIQLADEKLYDITNGIGTTYGDKIQVGGETSLRAIVSPAGSTAYDHIGWAVDNAGRASLSSTEGLTTTVKGLASGDVTVTAQLYKTATDEDPESATFKIGISGSKPAVEIVKVDPDVCTLVVGTDAITVDTTVWPTGADASTLKWTTASGKTSYVEIGSATGATNTLKAVGVTSALTAGIETINVGITTTPLATVRVTVPEVAARKAAVVLKDSENTYFDASEDNEDAITLPFGGTVTAEATLYDKTGNYKATDASLTWSTSIAGATIADSTSANTTIVLPQQATSGTITATAKNGKAVTVVLVDVRKLMSDVTIADIADQVYSGEEIVPELTLTHNGSAMTKDTDYTADFSDNTEAGTATVKVTGKGDFEEKAITRTFTIKKAALKNVVLNDRTYDGKKTAPTFKSGETENGLTLSASDITIKADTNANAGTRKATVEAKNDNYEGTLSVAYTIDKAALKNVVLNNRTYDGKKTAPTFKSGKTQNNIALKAADVTITADNNANAGSRTATVKAKNANYSGTLKVKYTINKANNTMKVKSNKLTVYGTGTGTITLSSTKRGKITYTPKDAKVAKAALKGNNGVITGLKPGTTTITVKDDGGTNYKASTANVTVTVKRPGNPSGLAVKNNKTGTLNISWKKAGNATGYYVEVKSGKKVVKKLTLKKLKTTVPKLKAGSKYTVNVWSYAGSKYSTNARSAKAASKTVTVK